MDSLVNTIPNVQVPEGTFGLWRVERFEVTEDSAALHNMREAMHGSRRVIQAGTYTKLCHNDDIVMSDTPSEKIDHLEFIDRAEGNVLIHGLGLGMVLSAVLRKPSVTDVTVVEVSWDVINLVWPTYSANVKAHLVHGDAFTWPLGKGVKWAAIWHDIWTDLCVDNLVGMTKLKRRFCRRCKWQGCWGEDELRYRQKRYGW